MNSVTSRTGKKRAQSAMLVLQNGRSFAGTAFGAACVAGGELVFTTSLTGYTEALTDPSFFGQILVFTNPLIGNYGFEKHRMESGRIHVSGVVISEQARLFSNPLARRSLDEALRQAGVPGIEGVDTREITVVLRTEGCQNGLLAPAPLSQAEMKKRMAALPDMKGLDLSGHVTIPKSEWILPKKRSGIRIALLDFGVKQNILNELLARGSAIWRLPASTPARAILNAGVDGLLLSNGPGDPGAMVDTYQRIRMILGRIPIFGICLGHQLLGLAAGLKTYKLKFGHRGTNHPVQDMRNRTIAITTQNHGFSVRPPARPNRDLCITHRSLYDGTVEGLELPGHQAFAVQFHPESTPGPHDSMELFDRFLAVCRKARR